MFNIVIFEITNKCNFSCKYCYENGKKNNIDLDILLFENFIKIIDFHLNHVFCQEENHL